MFAVRSVSGELHPSLGEVAEDGSCSMANRPSIGAVFAQSLGLGSLGGSADR